ncbi:MAG: Homoserine kinase [Methanomassiliicoccales archaeon PtaU1.Bin124]|nr:MAG: Homoserine kinase [Methanomassiliicoccales archaeon PtaU1.Bin124]
MSSDRVTVRAPATVANLGSGFDVFGIALHDPFDLIEAKRTSERGVRVEKVEGMGAHAVTLEHTKNTAAVAAAKVLEMGKADFGLTLHIKKGIRPCSGMGSSGAGAAGGAFAANLFLEKPLPMDQLLFAAAKGEEASSGSFHADNCGPSLYGGFTIIRSYDPLEIVRVNPPKNLGIVAALPGFAVPTREARKVLPKHVDLKDFIFQIGQASSFVAGMANNDIGLVARSVKDRIIEPARTPLIPHLQEAEEAAKRAGAMASFLGGSGPCICSFYDLDKVDGSVVGTAVQNLYENRGIECLCWVTTWGEGCRKESK